MNFRFTEEQTLIRDTARSYLADHAGSAQLRTALASPAGWDQALWRAVTRDLGWAGIAIPEAYGGLGLGLVELAILMEETGRRLAAIPLFASAGLAANAILAAGNEGQCHALLPGIASGETIAALGFTGPSGAPGETGLTLTRGLGSWRLDGEAGFVPYGHAADLLVLAARGPAGLSLVALPAGTSGLTVERLTALDQTRPLARIRCNGVVVAADAILGEPGSAQDALKETLRIGAALLAAEQAGGAEACLDMSVDYAKTRVQFGRPIGSFQAIKHKLADMMVEVESSRSAAYWAALALAEDSPDGPEAASIARAYASDAFCHAAGEAIQIHGGIGFTWEHDAHLYFKRARASATLLGDAAHHREKIAQLIGLDDALSERPIHP